MLDLTFGNVPSVLSELIRTVLIPNDGCRFIVADFSAIEARVLSWLAGERWRLETFRKGGDIYCASASQMFHVPVVKEPNLKDKELQDAFGCTSPMDIVEVIFKAGEIPQIAIECMKLAGYVGGVEAVKN